jgi:hypothetical protein
VTQEEDLKISKRKEYDVEILVTGQLGPRLGRIMVIIHSTVFLSCGKEKEKKINTRF